MVLVSPKLVAKTETLSTSTTVLRPVVVYGVIFVIGYSGKPLRRSSYTSSLLPCSEDLGGWMPRFKRPQRMQGSRSH